MVEAFVQFHIENLESEFLGGLDFGLRDGQFACVSCGRNHGIRQVIGHISGSLGAEFYDNFTAKLQIGNKAPLFHSKSLGKNVVRAGK